MPYPHLIQPETRTHELADRIRVLDEKRDGSKGPDLRACKRRRGLSRLVGLIGLVALVALVAFAFVGQGAAAPKPGFLPGTWIGKGTITGYVVDGPMATHFGGGVSFILKVSPKLAVSGSGTWEMTMLGSQDAPSDYAVDSTMKGTAAIRLAGPATAPTFGGTQKVVGEIRSGSMKTPISFERKFSGRLTISRAGTCLVRGVTVTQPGVKLTWSAQLKGSGKCNA
jgi:hypothetical protein